MPAIFTFHYLAADEKLVQKFQPHFPFVLSLADG